MKQLIVTFIFSTFIFSTLIPCARVYGCGNEYEYEVVTKATGIREKRPEYTIKDYDFAPFDTSDLLKKKSYLEESLKEKYSYEKESDYALVLLKLGEHKRALKILQKLVRKYPEEYNIVANLGTAYELNGKDDSALYYINKALEINPGSHEGSEWIHVAILKTKLRMKEEPQYLRLHPILPFSTFDKKTYHTEKLKEMELVREQLYWQLRERIAFVPAPDPVVADLLFSLANLVGATDHLEAAVPLYDESLRYRPLDKGKVEAMKKEAESTIFRSKLSDIVLWIFLVAMVVVPVILIFRKRKMVKKDSNDVPVYTSAHIEK